MKKSRVVLALGATAVLLLALASSAYGAPPTKVDVCRVQGTYDFGDGLGPVRKRALQVGHYQISALKVVDEISPDPTHPTLEKVVLSAPHRHDIPADEDSAAAACCVSVTHVQALYLLPLVRRKMAARR